MARPNVADIRIKKIVRFARHALSVAAFLQAAVTFDAMAQSPLMAPTHDIRLGVNLATLKGAIGKLSNTRYRGEYVHGGAICSSPEVELNLNTVQVSGGSFQNFADGRGGTSLNLNMIPTVNVSCVNITKSVNCVAGGILSDPLASIEVVGRCELWFLVFKQTFPIAIKIDPLITMEDHLDVELGDDTEEITTEFGAFENNVWVKSPKPKFRQVPLLIRGAGNLGQTDAAPVEPALWTTKDGDRYYVDASIGTLRGEAIASKSEGASRVSSDDPVGNDGFAGFSIADSFFGRTSIDSPGAGLFDEVLPVRISGKIRVKKNDLHYELFLTAARSVFSEKDGQPVIITEFAIERAKVFNLTIGKEHLVKEVGAQIVLELPAVEASGEIRSKIVGSSIHLSTFLGKACFCFDIPDLQKSLIRSLPKIGSVRSSVSLALPECIEVGESKMKARNGSWSAYGCRDHGGAVDGLIANVDQGKATTLNLDLSTTRPTLSADRRRIMYSVKALP